MMMQEIIIQKTTIQKINTAVMRLMINVMLLLISSISLSACSILSPVTATPRYTYMLNKLPNNVAQRRARAGTLFVMTTTADANYATTQMAYTTYPHQIAYFSLNEWAQAPAQMLQPLLVETLQRTHAYHAIVTSPYLGRYRYMLNVEVFELLQDFTPGRIPTLHLTLHAVISSAATSQVIAARPFTVILPIFPYNPYGGVIAANKATAILLQQIASFCTSHT